MRRLSSATAMRTKYALAAVLSVIVGASQQAIASDPAPSAGAPLAYEEQLLNGAKETDRVPLIVALHWSGSTPAEFSRYFQGVHGKARLVLVRGAWPRRSGYSFFPTNPYYYDLPEAQRQIVLKEQTASLARLLATLGERHPSPTKPILVGASQGGDLTYAIAARHPELIRAAFPLLATLPVPIDASKCKSAKVHAFHGTSDDVVSASSAVSAAQRMRECGATVRLDQYAGVGHDIPGEMQRDLAAAIDAILEQGPASSALTHLPSNAAIPR